MFASHPILSSPSTPFRQTAHYTPSRPSPLGQRSANISTPPWTMGSPSHGTGQKPFGLDENSHCTPVTFPNFAIHTEPPKRQSQTQPPNSSGGAPVSSPIFSSRYSTTQMSPASPSPSTRGKFADRYASQIANPMKTSASLARSKTRKMFLNRVKDDRDSDRFEARGEQMMHMDYLAEKRRWEESMARDLDGVVRDEDLEEDDLLPDEVDLRALDEYTSQEQAMEMAMMETMGQHPNEANGSFSDDEYDDIFMTLQDQPGANQSQDMDMS